MLNVYVMYLWRDLKLGEFNQLSSVLKCEKRKRIEKYKNYLDAQQVLLGDVLARYVICKHFNLLDSNLHFNVNEYGKPFLETNSNIQYNISHAGRYVVCVVNEGIPVGIDIEVIKPIDLKIARRFFSHDEYNYLYNQPTNLQTEIFYQLWTLKESYIKMVGKGLFMKLDDFSVLDEKATNYAYFHQFIKNEEVIGCICADKARPITCKVINYAELFVWTKFSKVSICKPHLYSAVL